MAITQQTELEPEDLQAVLLRLIESLTGDAVLHAPIGSREGAARAAVAVMATYRTLYPPTMEEAAEWILNLPGFSPQAFAQVLRQKYGG
jgi:hypothetical protein